MTFKEMYARLTEENKQKVDALIEDLANKQLKEKEVITMIKARIIAMLDELDEERLRAVFQFMRGLLSK